MTTSVMVWRVCSPRSTRRPTGSSGRSTAGTATRSSLRFLKTIDANTPAEADLHLVLDNYATHKTPAVQRWLATHLRFHLQFTPTSASWLNLVERWFAELTNRKLRRSSHRSFADLEADVRAWIEAWNTRNPSSGPEAPTRS